MIRPDWTRSVNRGGVRAGAGAGRVAAFTLVLLVLLGRGFAPGAQSPPGAAPYQAWANGPGADPAYFPIAVWLQQPRHAERYKAAGINLYVGLWRGPTGEQLTQLKQAGVRVICHQNETGLTHEDRDVIVGWMHGDEPDNAQSLGEGKGYGPPIAPERIVADYQRLKSRDPTRPILLNLGQGVAWDQWIGRGVRRNHPEDYPRYVKGCDIVSFDIYPAVHSHPDVAGRLEFVPRGVDRLREWSGGERIIWNCIEASRISNVDTKPTPEQVRAEVWMSLIHGSRGLIYFVHQFEPRFNEASLLDDPDLLGGVTRLNRQIHELAPVLNSPSLVGRVQVRVVPDDVPVDVMAKQHGGGLYLFAANMRAVPARATFRLAEGKQAGTVEVLGENRSVPLSGGAFQDEFGGYGVHLYKMDAIR